MSYLSTLLTQTPGLKKDLQGLDRWSLASRLAGLLTWQDGTEPEIWAIECKALRNARSTEEMLDQLDDFRGEATDRLDRHRQRLK